jgi:hypothetical protein
MPSTPRLVQALPGPDADEHAGGARAHEVEGGLVAGAAPDDDGDVELAHEALEVERLARARHVLGGDDRPLDHEQVELGGEDLLGPGGGALGRDARAGDDAGVLDLADAGADELGLERLEVDLLHAQRGLLGRELGDLLEQRLGVLVAAPQALEVEHADAAERPISMAVAGLTTPSMADPISGQVEVEGVDLPRDVDVLRVARAPAGHDGDVVEAVGPPARLPDPDLDLSHVQAPRCAPVRSGQATKRPGRRAHRGGVRSDFRSCLATAALICHITLAVASSARCTTVLVASSARCTTPPPGDPLQRLQAGDHRVAGLVRRLVAHLGEVADDLVRGHRAGRAAGDHPQASL